eukprot:3218558-Prymnesium_polylepis.1
MLYLSQRRTPVARAPPLRSATAASSSTRMSRGSAGWRARSSAVAAALVVERTGGLCVSGGRE